MRVFGSRSAFPTIDRKRMFRNEHGTTILRLVYHTPGKVTFTSFLKDFHLI